MATFVKVVESEGFSAAARALGISPSMATTHVRFLEERLGVRLLNRSTRRVSLTEAGQVYYERCLQILTEVEDADRAAQALQSTPRGTLRLNTSVAIPPFLAPVIAEFVTLYRPHKTQDQAASEAALQPVSGGYLLNVVLSDGRFTALLPADDNAILEAEGMTARGAIVVRLEHLGQPVQTVEVRERGQP